MDSDAGPMGVSRIEGHPYRLGVEIEGEAGGGLVALRPRCAIHGAFSTSVPVSAYASDGFSAPPRHPGGHPERQSDEMPPGKKRSVSTIRTAMIM